MFDIVDHYFGSTSITQVTWESDWDTGVVIFLENKNKGYVVTWDMRKKKKLKMFKAQAESGDLLMNHPVWHLHLTLIWNADNICV